MAPDSPGEFGRRLRELRETAALSQEELAERANLTAKAIGALERGERRRPYPNTIRALCAALDLDEDAARALANASRPPAADRKAARAPVTTLTTPVTPMLGRSADLAVLTALLSEPQVRVVTLTGPGGVGKTRLSLEVAGQLQAAGRDVVLVELAAIRRTELVLPAIARAFGVEAGSDDMIGSLAVLLDNRCSVLVLDNVEHLLDAATEIDDLVRRVPGISVLATSRSPLRLRVEREVPVAPLAVPLPGAAVGDVAASPAVQLFVDRARNSEPGFELTFANAPAVAEICRRLDGLPLALELAAAHVRFLAPPLLLERLAHVVSSARLRDLPDRQQTLTATLDWSHALLTTLEQDVLRALSVFAGGFDLDAAEQVVHAPGRDVLTAIEGLVEQSLVLAQTGPGHAGTSWFRMLESVRQYAGAALTADDATELATRHAAYYGRLGREASAGLRTAELPRWLGRLDREHANLGLALTTQLEHGDHGAAARFGADTWLYWALRGHAGEGLIWWQRVLEEGADALDEAGRAAAHLTLAGLRLATADLSEAQFHSTSAADLARSSDERSTLSEGLIISTMSAASASDIATAVTHLAELTELCRDSLDPWEQAHVLLARAQVSLLQGDIEDCAAALRDAEGLARDGAGPFPLATVLNMRTTLALLAEDHEAALDSASEAAELAADLGTTWTLVYTLSALATIAVQRRRPDLAAQLFAAGAATAETSLVDLAFRPDLESARAHIDETRRQLSADDFDRCWQRGRTLRAEELPRVIAEIRRRPEPR